MSSKVIVVRADAGFHVRVTAGNNEIVFASQVYDSRESAEHAAEYIRNTDLVKVAITYVDERTASE